MCYFITIAIPKDKSGLLDSHKMRGLSLYRTSNRSILELIPKEYIPYFLISGMCSCDLFKEEQEDADKEKLEDSLRKKYMKKGWSKSKIERAITQSIIDSEKNESHGLRDDIIHFIWRLCREVGLIYFIAHWYSGDTETEKVFAKGERSISPDDVESLHSISKANIIYKIEGVG